MFINFQALGCRLNEAELEPWASDFMQRGHQVTTDAAEADVVVFNSCAVTAQADRKSRQQIGRLQRSNPDAALVVTGCHSSLNPDAVKRYLGVDLVIDNQQKEQLVDRTLALASNQGTGGNLHEPVLDQSLNALLLRGRHRGFIKIQDGCRYRCTYCIVTIARGAERSRSEAEILDEIHHSVTETRKLLEKGLDPKAGDEPGITASKSVANRAARFSASFVEGGSRTSSKNRSRCVSIER